MIDWREVVNRFNERHGTTYRDDQALLADLYHEHGLSTYEIGDRLLVSHATVRLRMIRHGIGRRHQYILRRFLFWTPEQLSQMTTPEIAEAIGTSTQYAWQLCKRYGRRWRKYGKPEGYKKEVMPMR